MNVEQLTCEDLDNPLGIDVRQPRLSWRMVSDARGATQGAYQILCASATGLLEEGKADLWDTGKVSGDASRLIPYGGKALLRGMPCFWRVRIWPARHSLGEGGNENDEVSAWSEPARWTYAGMASDKDWQAKWITHNTSSPWLRQTLELKAVPSRAYIYCNALGYFQLFINGRRVGNDEFAPHVSQFDKRTFCITYDVTSYLKEGRNAIGFWLGRGWSGETDIQGWPGMPGPALRAQLEAIDNNNSLVTLVTDETWRAKLSSMAHQGTYTNSKFGGEIHTASEDQPDWADSEFDDSAWSRALPAEVPDIPVSSQMLQPSRVIDILRPVSVKRGEAPAEWIIDMGKAMTGTFEITLPKAEQGRRVSLEFGDAFTPGEDGKCDTLKTYGQASEYICRGSGTETFRNRFSYASCQYILIHNAPEGEITPGDIVGHLITTDLPRASSFRCSDETLNGIYRMMEHTLRCLMLGGYQVDCHSRERLGYGGDGQSSLDTTLCLLRSDAFYRKWIRDWVDSQAADGGLTYTAPATGAGGGPFWCGFLPATTLKHYHHYGDITVVQQNYPAVKKWLELAQRKTVDDQQEKFCGGWYLGDWASPEGTDDEKNADIFIQSYMPYVLEQGAQLADVLGETADAERFRQWAAARRAATHKKLYDPDSRKYGSGDQVTYVLPLAAGVVPEELRDEVFAEFEKTLLVKDKGHLSTGLSGTYMMVQYLQHIGRDDLIYRFASKTTYPSWGYMIENGATATWESWEGTSPAWTWIHNCFNNIGSWFIQGLAGIRPDPENPGFKNAIIKPAFIKELDFVNGSYDSVYGTIESNWKREGDHVTLDVVIPPNTTATIMFPNERPPETVAAGRHQFELKI